MNIPKTPRGLSGQITRIRRYFSSSKREFGFIDDGNGSRYYLFYLYFLLNDNRRSSEYIRWFEKEFPDDSCEPFQFLCWALILYRMNKKKDAEYRLAETMLSNIYLIPHLLGDPIDRVDMWHSSNYEDPEMVDYLPEEIQKSITEDELAWIQKLYRSDPFQKLLSRHIAIYHKLENLRAGDKREALIKEQQNLLDPWK